MPAAISIQNLRKVYRGQLEALKGISLEVEQGDFFGLLGPNGAGKSTAIGIICSLVNKTSGQVWVDGNNIDVDLQAVKLSLGLVPQEFNFSIFEPVLEICLHQAGYYGLPRRQALERAEKYLTQMGLWEKRNEPARNLSGGMKRRLLIARAMLHEPKILILDEPTAGVDIELRRSMWHFLEAINQQGTTILLTTHYLEEAEQLCKTIAIIHQGEIVENLPKRELLRKLDFEIFVLDLAKPLFMPPDITNAEVTLIDSHTLEVRISKSMSINNVFSILTAQNIEVLSMRNKTNRLEELFLNLTTEKEIQ